MPSDRSHTVDSDEYDPQDVDHGLNPSRKVGNPLQRGSACLNCRKRKMKCDATKPVCRQCVKANRQEECDYDDGRQKSRTQILQEKIAKLEDRIRELEREEDEANEQGEFAGGFDFDPSGASGAIDGQMPSFYDLGPGFDYSGASGSANVLAPFGDARDATLQLDLAASSSAFADSYAGAGTGTLLDVTNGNVANGSSSSSYASFNPHTSHSDHFGFATSTNAQAHYGPSASSSSDPSSYLQQDPLYAASLGVGVGVSGVEGTLFDPSTIGAIGGPGFDLIAGTGALGAVGAELDSMANIFAPMATNNASTTSLTSTSYAPSQRSTYANPFAASSSTYGTSSLQPFGASESSPTFAFGSGFTRSSGKKPRNRWDVDNLPVAERSFLAEVFLPHAQQCGLDMSPKRFRQRLGIDVLTNAADPGVPHTSDDRPPPAHPALANAIFLLASHFALTAAELSNTATYALPHVRPETIKKELGDAESCFLTRALRGIAAALEAGEAAATASSSSGSDRASLRSRSSSRSFGVGGGGGGGGSRHGTASPLSQRSASRSPTFPGPSMLSADRDGMPDPATPLVDAVQASALLAVYFFAKARLLEGYYHSSAAARLAVSLGMHQIKSAVWSPPQVSPTLSGFARNHANSRTGGVGPGPSSPSLPGAPTAYSSTWQSTPITSTPLNSYSIAPVAKPRFQSVTAASSFSPEVLLPPAKDAATHRERISAFWTVFIIDRCWSVATGLPSSLPDDEHPQLRISSVWPWEHDDSTVMSRMNADYSSLSIMFEQQTSAEDLVKGCSKALKAKASALFERAARISSKPTYWEQFTQLEHAIGLFTSSLPSYIRLHPQVKDDSVDVELALVHTLAYAAVIQLHHPQAQKDARAHGECVRAASRAMRIARTLSYATDANAEKRIAARFALTDPVIGTCWMCVADVLLREKGYGGNMEGAKNDPMLGGVVDEVFGVEEELEAVVGALKRLSAVFPVAQYQVQKVEQSLRLP